MALGNERPSEADCEVVVMAKESEKPVRFSMANGKSGRACERNKERG